MTPKKQQDKTMYIIAIAVAVIVIGAYSIKVAQYFFLDPEATYFQCILFAYKTFENKVQFDMTFGNIMEFLKHFFYSFFMLAFITVLIGYYYYAERKAHPTDMFGKEHGTAKWNDSIEKFQRKYMDMKNGIPSMNQMVLSNALRLTLNTRKSMRNLIKVIIGGSGAGKSRFFVKPNVMQLADMSMLINDPSGEILESTGKLLQYNGWDVKIFNIVDMEQSHRYNPFDYIRDTNARMKENGVTTMVSCILANTSDPNAQKGDQFWEDSIRALFQAICFLLVDFYPKEERTIAKVYDLVLAGQVDENKTDDSESELDKIFRDKEVQAKLEGIKSKAFKNYKTFKLAGVKTAANILVSAGVRVQNFDNTSVRLMTTTDTAFPENNLHLETIGNKKTALFVILPIADDTFKFLPSLMYSQMIETLYYTAENVCPKKYHIKSGEEILISMYDSKKLAEYELKQYKNAHIENEEERINNPEEDEDGILNYSECRIIGEDGNILKTFPSYKSAREFLDKIKHGKVVRGRKELPHHTQLIQDELANTGTIPNYSKVIATMRKYKMGADIILQNQQQLEGLYKDDFKSIMGNADTLIFLGSNETETAKNISDMLGNTTIKTRSVSQQKGKNGGYSVSWSSSARKLMEPDEVLNMENDKCIVKIRGVHPFLTEKYVYEEHPNYKYTGDCWDENKVLPDDDDFYNRIFKGREDSQSTQKAIRFKRRIANMFEKNKDENGKPLIGKPMPMNTEGQIKDAFDIRSKNEIKEKVGVAENVSLPKDPDKGVVIPDETLMWGF